MVHHPDPYNSVCWVESVVLEYQVVPYDCPLTKVLQVRVHDTLQSLSSLLSSPSPLGSVRFFCLRDRVWSLSTNCIGNYLLYTQTTPEVHTRMEVSLLLEEVY